MEKTQAISGRGRGRLPIARQGWPFILGSAVLTIIAALLCWWIVAAVMAVLLLFVLNFFRDPDRVTPADGKVVRAEATESGLRIAFTQIAGLVARRIVSYVAVGDHVAAGQRIGMIRFGSRVDCEVPAGYTLRVKLGDHVTAGLTVLAERA